MSELHTEPGSRAAIVEVARNYLGVPYRKRQAGEMLDDHPLEEGLDCSEFLRLVLREAGLPIPDYLTIDNERRPINYTHEFMDYYGVTVHPEQRQAGDQVYFSRGGWRPNHVGIMVSRDSYVHASYDAGEVVESDLEFTDIAPEIPPGRNHLYTHNPVAFKSPAMPFVSPTGRAAKHTLPPIIK